jgi:uncharacterized membrane protein
VLLCPLLAIASCAEWNVGRSGTVVEARVVRIVESGMRDFEGAAPQPYQRLEVEIESGLYRGDRVIVPWGMYNAINEMGILREGDRVLVSNRPDPDGSRQYVIEEVMRLPALLPFAAVLSVVLLAIARWKGIAALAGLAGSVAIFLAVVVPAVSRGEDPLGATLAASAAVLVVSVYVVHGLNRKSTAALVGTTGGLAIVVVGAGVGLSLAHLTGFGTEEAVYLAVSAGGRIDMSRLVLAGMIVGCLGALVDMSVGQASATFELASVDAGLRGRALYASALNVGRDHIGSLINTLALAYFGGALPLIILVSLGNAPPTLAVNSELITESLLSIVVASIGLVLCVPITTAVAVWLARRD